MNELPPTQPVEQPVYQPNPEELGVGSEDRVGAGTIYTASAGSIMWRNFLAGMSRGLGVLFMQTIGIVLILLVLQRVVLPQLQPLFEMFEETQQSLRQLQGASAQQQNLVESMPESIRQQLNRAQPAPQP